MAEFTREADVECDVCGSEAPVRWIEWGPSYTAEHDTPQQPVCRYCYVVSGRAHDPVTVNHLAQMFNALESVLRELHGKEG